MYLARLLIQYENEIEVVQADENSLELRQRWLDTDPWGQMFILNSDELRDLAYVAKFLGWEGFKNFGES